MKRIISTNAAPAAIGPYSQAVEVNGTLYISGQIPVCPATGALVEADIKKQTAQVFANIGAILAEAGYSFSDVVKTTVFLADIAFFADMNAVYETYFPENSPARSAVAVCALPKGALVEVETVAVKG